MYWSVQFDNLFSIAGRDFPQAELGRLVAAHQASSGEAAGSACDAESSAPLNPWQVPRYE